MCRYSRVVQHGNDGNGRGLYLVRPASVPFCHLQFPLLWGEPGSKARCFHFFASLHVIHAGFLYPPMFVEVFPSSAGWSRSCSLSERISSFLLFSCASSLLVSLLWSADGSQSVCAHLGCNQGFHNYRQHFSVGVGKEV